MFQFFYSHKFQKCLAIVATLAFIVFITYAVQNTSSAEKVFHSLSLEEHEILNESSNSTRTKHVLITGEGRSGSTLVGSFFDSSQWSYYFEPLRDVHWQGLDSLQKVTNDKGEYCSAYAPELCTAANIAALFEVLQCQNSSRPSDLLFEDIEFNKNYTTLDFSMNALEVIKASFSYGKNSNPDLYPITSPPECIGKVGIAAKIIRLTGRLGQLFEVSDYFDLKLDLVVHLVRDPRAMLYSRYSVNMPHPDARNYDSTLSWAKDVCKGTMADLAAGKGHGNYMLLRYEDLAISAEAITTEMYSRIGLNLPDDIRLTARTVNGCNVEDEIERNECLEVLNRLNVVSTQLKKKKKGKFSTYPRNFSDQINKWQKFLTRKERLAVEKGCKDVYKSIYPDAELLNPDK